MPGGNMCSNAIFFTGNRIVRRHHRFGAQVTMIASFSAIVAPFSTPTQRIWVSPALRTGSRYVQVSSLDSGLLGIPTSQPEPNTRTSYASPFPRFNNAARPQEKDAPSSSPTGLAVKRPSRCSLGCGLSHQRMAKVTVAETIAAIGITLANSAQVEGSMGESVVGGIA